MRDVLLRRAINSTKERKQNSVKCLPMMYFIIKKKKKKSGYIKCIYSLLVENVFWDIFVR